MSEQELLTPLAAIAAIRARAALMRIERETEADRAASAQENER